MKAAYLIKYGAPETAFEIRQHEIPVPKADQVLIRVEAFGLNFADVMARLGLYKGAPPIPSVLGYDVVGYVEKMGSAIENLALGDRVAALTRFGGYAEYALAQKVVVFKIAESMEPGTAVALATQYSTAHFLAYGMANVKDGENVLIHAAAGGVGTALVQLAILRNCTIFGTCSSEEKMAYLRQNGVQYPINSLEMDYRNVVIEVLGDKGLDVVFDPIGGKSIRKGFRLLTAGGRLLSYGVSSMNNAKSIFGKIKVLAQFGLYHPLQFLSQSKGLIGVNMLNIADENPKKVANSMREVVRLTNEGRLKPYTGGEFPIGELADAHRFLESRKSMGKIVVKW